MTTALNHSLANYDSIATALTGHSLTWLQEFRTTAWHQFLATGFPTSREEAWRYTHLSALEKKSFSLTVAPNDSLADDILRSYRLADAFCVVLINGHFSAALSELTGLPDNIDVMSMADAITHRSDVVQNYLGTAVNHTEHGFIALNSACFTDGLFIHSPGKRVLNQPIQILNIVNDADRLATTRNLIIADDHSELTIIETFVGNQAYLTTAVTELFIGANAKVSLFKMQSESTSAYHFGGTYAHVAENARFYHYHFAFGGLLARTDLTIALNQAAECELNGLTIGTQRQHIDHHTRVEHNQPYGISREFYKGVFDDKARGVFQGRIIVAKNAQHTDSQMNNRNLLLSDQAEADSKPQLEIYADDVKCGHGLTVGQLDEQSISYLQSRCIDKETARNILTFAFANEMVSKVTIKNLHDQLLQQVLNRFPQKGIDTEWL